jgi:hypothetical protein
MIFRTNFAVVVNTAFNMGHLLRDKLHAPFLFRSIPDIAAEPLALREDFEGSSTVVFMRAYLF